MHDTNIFNTGSGSNSLYSIEKLNDSNFSSWKFQLKMILMDRGLWGYVDGSQVCPVVNERMDEAAIAAARVKIEEWKKKDNSALVQIALTVSKPQLGLIKSAQTAREAWLKVLDIHEAKGLAARVFLRRKFFTTLLQEGDTMREHINKVREMAEQMEAIGAPVTDHDVAMTLFCSLPAQYLPLITSLEARSESELTADFVATRLLADEKRRQELSNQGTAEAAFVGSSNSKGTYGGDNGSEGQTLHILPTIQEQSILTFNITS